MGHDPGTRLVCMHSSAVSMALSQPHAHAHVHAAVGRIPMHRRMPPSRAHERVMSTRAGVRNEAAGRAPWLPCAGGAACCCPTVRCAEDLSGVSGV
eukprot:350660-Chlamydomonas_euryale.AAC.12